MNNYNNFKKNIKFFSVAVPADRFLGASVNGKPPVSKTGTAGSIPAAPANKLIL